MTSESGIHVEPNRPATAGLAAPTGESFAAQLTAARAGSGPALGRLLEGYRQYLQVVAERRLNTFIRPKLAPSDIVQEALIEAGRGLGGFRGDSPRQFRAWLRQVLLNNLVDQLRVRSREARLQVPLSGSASRFGRRPLVDLRPTPHRALAARETAEALERALALLSSDHQAVIRMRHHQGLSFDEIARRLNRSPNAAQKLWMRAVCQLREKFEADGES